MPALALPAFWGAIGTGAAAGAAAYGSHKVGQAAEEGVAAQREATAAQTKSNEETLAFEKDQAAKQYAADEANRRANYDQWAAREGRLSSLGQMLGLPGRQIPAYAALPPTAPAGSVSATAPGGSAPAGTGSGLDLVKQATANGLQGQAAVDWINQQRPGSAVVVPAGSASPPGKVVWYDKGNGAGKFQMVGPENWEYKIDPALGPGWQYAQLSGGGGLGAPGSIRALTSSAAPSVSTPAYMAPRIAAPTSAASGSIRFLTQPQQTAGGY